MNYSRKQLEAFGEPLGECVTRKEGGRIIYGGGGSSSTPATQTQVVDLPDWAKPYAQETLAKTKAITATPYQQYNAPRIAGFSPLQEQAMQTTAGLQPSQMGQFGGQLAGAAALGALGTQYRPFQMGQFTSGRAAQYMNPFVEQAMEPQLREAQRTSEMQRVADMGQATRAGAFGGSRQAILEAERQRNLGTQLGDIRARGYMSAFDQAQQNFAREQQLREQSRQYGAGLGMQGLQTALQGAGQLGALGGQEFGQQKDIIGLQSQMGAQQQALRQQGLSQAYQDFLNEQNYPYKQLGFMSDMIRGLPLGQQSTTQIYQPPSSLAGQLGGIGMGLYGLSRAGAFAEGGQVDGYAEGGQVDGYAEGGDVTSQYNVDDIISNLSDAQLQQARVAALNSRDQQRLEMIDGELAQRVSMRAGLGGAFNMLPEDTQDNIITAAGGGIVALAGGGDFAGVGPEFGGYSGADEAPKARSTSEVDRIVDALRAQGRTIGLSQVRDIMAGKGDYSALLAPAAPAAAAAASAKPAAPAAVPYDRATATRREDFQKKPSTDGGINAALAQIAQRSGASERSIKSMFEDYKKSFEAESASDLKSMLEMVEKSTGGSKKVKEESIGRALADFGFKWAAAAAKPGAKFFGSAAEASPTLTASLAESAKLAREMDENDLKLRMNLKQFEIAQRAGNRKEALAAAAQERMLLQNQAQLELRRQELAQTAALAQAQLGQRESQFARTLGMQERTLGVQERNLGVRATLADIQRARLRQTALKDWEAGPGPRLERQLAQQYGKNWNEQPKAQAEYQTRKNDYMGAKSTSTATPLSSLLDNDDMKLAGLTE